jgi:hypothetical protein
MMDMEVQVLALFRMPTSCFHSWHPHDYLNYGLTDWSEADASLRRTSHKMYRSRIQHVSYTDLRASIAQLPTCSPAHCSLISLDPKDLLIDIGSISQPSTAMKPRARRYRFNHTAVMDLILDLSRGECRAVDGYESLVKKHS